MTLQSAQQQLLLQLKKIYDERESINITHWVMEHLTGKKNSQRIIDKNELLTGAQTEKLKRIQEELSAHRPVQYVLGEAWFAGMKFYVNEYVLIPRPETEELIEGVRSKEQGVRVLDIGTGSGCIPIALKKKFPGMSITSLDISKEALVVAKQNAVMLDADIEFLNTDFLEDRNWVILPVFDIIISNPPYIKASERSTMAKNVLDFEPGIALFVPAEDPLLFYRKIVSFAKTHLVKGGSIFLEINEALGEQVVNLYEEAGFTVELKKDMQGRDRMVKAIKINN